MKAHTKTIKKKKEKDREAYHVKQIKQKNTKPSRPKPKHSFPPNHINKTKHSNTNHKTNIYEYNHRYRSQNKIEKKRIEIKNRIRSYDVYSCSFYFQIQSLFSIHFAPEKHKNIKIILKNQKSNQIIIRFDKTRQDEYYFNDNSSENDKMKISDYYLNWY